MSVDPATVIIVTIIWGCVAIVCPCFVPKGVNRGLTQLMLTLTGACCWMFWFLVYLAQINPLIGPKLAQSSLLIIAREWGYPMNVTSSSASTTASTAGAATTAAAAATTAATTAATH